MPNKVTKFLTKKAGPFPVWVWFVIGAVSYFIWKNFFSGMISGEGSVAAVDSTSPAYTGESATPVMAVNGGALGTDSQINDSLVNALVSSIGTVGDIGITGMSEMGSLSGMGYSAISDVANTGLSALGDVAVTLADAQGSAVETLAETQGAALAAEIKARPKAAVKAVAISGGPNPGLSANATRVWESPKGTWHYEYPDGHRVEQAQGKTAYVSRGPTKGATQTAKANTPSKGTGSVTKKTVSPAISPKAAVAPKPAAKAPAEKAVVKAPAKKKK